MGIDIKRYLEPHKSPTMSERLDMVKRRFADTSHIEVDQEAFRADAERAVLFLCPAQVFKLNEQDQTCIVNYEDCLECGTCQVDGATRSGAIRGAATASPTTTASCVGRRLGRSAPLSAARGTRFAC